MPDRLKTKLHDTKHQTCNQYLLFEYTWHVLLICHALLPYIHQLYRGFIFNSRKHPAYICIDNAHVCLCLHTMVFEPIVPRFTTSNCCCLASVSLLVRSVDWAPPYNKYLCDKICSVTTRLTRPLLGTIIGAIPQGHHIRKL